MDMAAHIGVVEREGAALSTSARQAGASAPVPTCPEWTVRDLTIHVGTVHRWAHAHVAGARAELIEDEELERIVGPPPPDSELFDWFDQGCARLVAALRDAPADLAAFTFLPAPSPLAFWARRQAHETTIHRLDADAAAGTHSPVDEVLAADGLDELLRGFVPRPRRRDVAPSSLLVAVDGGHCYLIHLDPEHFTVDEAGAADGAEADCTLSGPAAALYPLLWNRGPAGVTVDGDPAVLDAWRGAVTIRWS
jgi:uncharacterized protein (TIGR03083 family)